MSDSPDISVLLERVRAASGPDENLDDLIAAALGFDERQCVTVDSGLTASLDAAVALVERLLPGREWIVRNNPRNHPPSGAAVGMSKGESASTPALALIAAALDAVRTRAPLESEVEVTARVYHDCRLSGTDDYDAASKIIDALDAVRERPQHDFVRLPQDRREAVNMYKQFTESVERSSDAREMREACAIAVETSDGHGSNVPLDSCTLRDAARVIRALPLSPWRARKADADLISIILAEDARIENGALANIPYLAVKIAESIEASPLPPPPADGEK